MSENRKLFLHIGLGKTGTTALQNFLLINNKKLIENGIYYLKSPLWRDNSHHVLSFAFFDKNHPDYPAGQNFDKESVISNIKKEISSLPDNVKNIIISSELLSHILWTKSKNDFIKFIKETFNNVKIICYLRRQDEHIECVYKQWVRTHNKRVENKGINDFYKDYQGEYYDKMLDTWSNEFGSENINVRIYEKKQLKSESVIDDFLNVLGLQYDSSYKLPDKNRSNIGLSTELIILLQKFSTLLNSNEYNIMNRIISNIDSKNGDYNLTNNSLLSPEQKKKILSKYEESNQYVARKYLKHENGSMFTSLQNTSELKWQPPEVTYDTLLKLFSYVFKNQNDTIAKLEKNEINNDVLIPISVVYILNEDIIKTSGINNLRYEDLNGKRKYLFDAINNDPILFLPIKLNKGNATSFIIEIDITAPSDTTLELFYSNTESEQVSFLKEQCLQYKIKKGSNLINLFFRSEIFSGWLRLDPGHIPGKYEISSFKIIGINE